MGPPEMPMVGMSQLVAAHEQHHAVERVAADRLFHVHAREIAEQHGGGAQLGFTERHHGKFQRESARFVDTTLHELREFAEMPVAGSQFTPGVAYPDDGTTVEQVVRVSLVLDPASMQKAVFAFSAEPGLTSPRALLWNIHRDVAYRWLRYAKNNFLRNSHTWFGMTRLQHHQATPFMSSAQP
jgi:hypothetical protein